MTIRSLKHTKASLQICLDISDANLQMISAAYAAFVSIP